MLSLRPLVSLFQVAQSLLVPLTVVVLGPSLPPPLATTLLALGIQPARPC